MSPAPEMDPTPEEERLWREWVDSRPMVVQRVIYKHGFVPWKLYRLSGHRVTLHAFDEHAGDRVTLRVVVSGKYNLVAFERTVFGVDPDDLKECAIPSHHEVLGTVLTEAELEEAVRGVAPGPERAEAIIRAAMAKLRALRERAMGAS